jgi:hypothetical protein
LGNEDVKGLLGRLGKTDSKPAGALEKPEGSDGAQPELESFGEWLAAETGGQPFYLVETLKALLEEGELAIQLGADGEPVVEVGPALGAGSDLRGLLPTNVREVIRAPLSSFARRLRPLEGRGSVGARL